ncbi:MAG: hypothetical protein ACK5YI_20485 [Rhodospirillales bacterium]|jgi:hypothetical protein
MTRSGPLAALVALLPLLAAIEAAAQTGVSTTASTAMEARTVRPVPPTRPQPVPTGPQATTQQATTQQAATQQADVERQVRDMILRQGRMQMNALVPGAGLVLSPDRFDDDPALPPAAVGPPVRVDGAQAAKPEGAAPPRRPPARLQRFRMGERVSEPLPMRRAGNYGW